VTCSNNLGDLDIWAKPRRFAAAVWRLFGKALGSPLAFNTCEALQSWAHPMSASKSRPVIKGSTPMRGGLTT